MKTEIRQATLEDVPVISSIFRVLEGGRERWSRKMLRNSMGDEKRRYYVITEDNNPVGAISLDLISGDCELEAIAISKKGNGYGTKLLEIAERVARDKKCRGIWCYSTGNYKAKGFYESNGWVETDIDYDKASNTTTFKFSKALN